jgi:hypothetical protein
LHTSVSTVETHLAGSALSIVAASSAANQAQFLIA